MLLRIDVHLKSFCHFKILKSSSNNIGEQHSQSLLILKLMIKSDGLDLHPLTVLDLQGLHPGVDRLKIKMKNYVRTGVQLDTRDLKHVNKVNKKLMRFRNSNPISQA